MQDFNYHTHTFRCHHAVGSDEEYVIKAIEGGFKTIGFSDHAPIYGFSNKNRMEYEQFVEYKNSILTLKDKYKDQIDVKLGIEAEWYLNDNKAMNDFFNELDYVILAMHGNGLNDQFKYAHPKTSDDIFEYGKLCVQAMGQRNWLYLAHPDYYLRRENDFNQTCVEVAHMIGAKAQETNTILEINITGLCEHERVSFKQGDYYFYPNRLFWQIISQYDVKCVYGLDAHKPELLANGKHYFDLAYHELSDLNLQIIDKLII